MDKIGYFAREHKFFCVRK